MILSKFPQIVALLFLVCMSKFPFETLGDVMPSSAECLNCSKCEPPCQDSPPAVSGYPSYGTPPPPAPAASPPPPSGYAIYEAQPPPPHAHGQSKCPPAPGAQCCTPPFPYTISPPNPYTMSPPNPYTYLPYGGGNSATMLLLPILVPLVMLSSSFVFLF